MWEDVNAVSTCQDFLLEVASSKRGVPLRKSSATVMFLLFPACCSRASLRNNASFASPTAAARRLVFWFTVRVRIQLPRLRLPPFSRDKDHVFRAEEAQAALGRAAHDRLEA